MVSGKPGPPQWSNMLPEVIDDFKKLTDSQVLARLRKLVKASQEADFWLTDEGQAELLRKYEANERPPSSPGVYGSFLGCSGSFDLCTFDYTEASKAMLSAASASEEEWIEVELTADTGACDTVIPRTLCPSIPIRPSLQSLRGMEYEVADGRGIPNLGERRCLMWTEGAGEARHVNMQVADVHKGLLSLSRCADMGFEGRFGRTMGALANLA